MKYGLIGKKISHSVSPVIHKELGGYNYDLFEVQEENLVDFFKERDFWGINVTIPYKEKVIKYIDELDGIAKEIGVVNTIVNKDGKLIGYNTDYFGFEEMLRVNHVNVSNKSIAILGNGGVSKTVQLYMRNKGAKSVEVYTHRDIDFGVKSDAEIVVNCTPVGKYPDTNSPVDFNNLRNAKVAIDLIYNPYNTTFLLDAKSRNIRTINGLYMLVAQAKIASELFTDSTISNDKIDSLYCKMKRERLNIVLTGMGGAGKTTIGKTISDMFSYEFLDTDKLIEERVNMSTCDHITKYGESEFRSIEQDIVLSLEDKRGVVIATGGGTILEDANLLSLKRNGMIVFINTPIDCLSTKDRPLYPTIDKLLVVYAQRLEKYLNADYIIANDHTSSVEEIAKEIMDETFSY